MRVNSLAFDTLQAFDTKASFPKEAKQAPETSAKAEPAILAKPVEPSQKPIVNGLGLGLSFTVDEPTGRSIIRVVDVETGEVIRQIPSDEALAFLHQYEKQRGILFSRKL
jgi:flagellar protein FlaG